MMMRGG
jgi:hypothetical protein